jgi:WD40 repeat protein
MPSSAPTVELERAVGINCGVPSSLYVLHPSTAVAGMTPPSAAEVAPLSNAGAPASIRCLSAVGACVVVSDLLDPHSNAFLRGHASAISSCRLSPSGRLLATGERGVDSDVCVWELASGRVLRRFQEHDHGIAALAFSDDERLLASMGSDKDGLLILWDLSTGAQVARLKHNPSPSLCVAWGGFAKDIKNRDTGLYQFATGEGPNSPRRCVPLFAHSLHLFHPPNL